MKKLAILSTLTLGLIAAMAAAPAWADSVLYDNTVAGTSYQTGGFGVVAGFYAVSDSFTLSGNATITGAMLGIWVGSGTQATSVSWAITSSPFTGTTYASGTSSVLSSVNVPTIAAFASDNNAEVDKVTFALPGLLLGAGSYWLELDGVTTNGGESAVGVYWDESDGGSTVFADLVPYGELGIFGPSTGSQSFQILGTEETAATPEPSSFLLLGSGLAGLAGVIKRRLKA
jgi:hypothetical protein